MAALRQRQAVEAQAARFRARLAVNLERRRDEALVRQGFVHRFLLAMQETCVAKRAALLAEITEEQNAAIAQLREKARMEAKGRIERTLGPVRARHRDEQHGLRASRYSQVAVERHPRRPGKRNDPADGGPS